ncbi:MAG: CBS domain-containing protein [Candidatus Bathyarchaeia archaeon]
MVYVIKNVMTKEVVRVDSEDTIEEVSKVMAEKRRGYAVVLKAGRPVGMVTERDFVWKVIAESKNPSEVKVSDVMSAPLITVDPDADLSVAVEVMEKHQIRRVPVTKDEIIYGIITTRDIINHFDKYVKKAIIEVARYAFPRFL